MTSAPPSAPAPAGPAAGDVTDADLPLIETRCRVKAEGARWAAQRRRRIAEGADYYLEIEPMDREIIEKAKKVPDCFLWMNHPSGPSPSDLGLLDDLGGSFEALADAIALVRALLGESEAEDADFERALNLMAEAQAGVRAAVRASGYNNQDRDQLYAYQWLRGICWRSQIYIRRYMRLTDDADPREWPSIENRIQELDAQVRERQQLRKQYESTLKRARYHAQRLHRGNGADSAHDWQVLIEGVDALVAGGTPPSSTELRELVLPLLDKVPDVPLPRNVELVLREADRYLATRPAPQAEEERVEPTAEVRQVAAWLAGKVLVLIGGVPRPHAREALRRAFGLAEVDWIETREHESIAPFESHIARPEVGVVLLAIRWSSHAFENVKQFCTRHGKPLVRLPAGYNPNQVAVQIVQQCSGQL